MSAKLKGLDELFPFEYSGGGYFRRKGVPVNQTAEILHGHQAVEFLYDAIKKSLEEPSGVDMNQLVYGFVNDKVTEVTTIFYEDTI